MITFKTWTRHPQGQPDLICPVILCDACHEPIVGPGNVLWISDHNNPDDQPEIWHSHKGPCDRALSKHIRDTTGAIHESTRELSEWLAQLHCNAVVEPPPCALGEALPNPWTHKAASLVQKGR